MNGWQFQCYATNSVGTAYSSVAVLTVYIGIPVSITSPPGNQTVSIGQSAIFTVQAAGNPAPAYQWQYQPAGSATWSNLSDNATFNGSASPVLTVNGATTALDGQFQCVASTAYSSATSSPATLAVNGPLTVIGQPVGSTINCGATAALAIAVNGTGLSYQWYLGASGDTSHPVSGATAASFNPALTQTASFWVLVGNTFGSQASATATVTVTAVGAWGYDNQGQINVPTSLTNVLAVAGGDYASLALKSDGTVVGWGANFAGETSIPPGLGGVVALGIGDEFSAALKSDGTVAAWGFDGHGETNVPAGLAGVVAIAVGSYHTLALKADGTVMAWGSNVGGQSSVPAGLANVVAVAAGYEHSLALKSDGTVVAWGQNADGECNAPAGLTGVVAIAAGESHSVAVKSDGTVVAWGSNYFGETTVPAGLGNVVGIAAGALFSVALRADGTLMAWGRGGNSAPAGQVVAISVGPAGEHTLALFFPSAPVVASPPANQTVAVGQGAGFTALATGTPGPAWQWQLSSDGGTTWGNVSPGGSYSISNFTSNDGNGATSSRLVVGNTTSAMSGNLFRCVATNSAGSANSAAAMLTVNYPPAIGTQPAANTIFAGQSATLSVVATSSGALSYQWYQGSSGDTSNPVSGATASSFTTPVLTQTTSFWVLVSGAGLSTPSTTVTVTVSPPVVAWGPAANYQGETTVPATLANVVAVAAGDYHSLALKNDGTVVAWGSNYYGESVTSLSGLTGIVAVAAGDYHNLALRSDGTVLAWGYNGLAESTVPAGLANVMAIAAANEHSVALKANGTVVAWGDNSDGESSVPAGLNGVVAIAAGTHHTLALKTDGTVVGWGDNSYGESAAPAGLAGVVAIAAGGFHSLALKSDGTVVSWGTNNYGESSTPAGLTGVVAIAAAALQSLAVKADGTLVGWGDNTYGESQAPPGLGGVVAVATGSSGFDVALVAPFAPAVVTSPLSQTAVAGQAATFTAVATGGQPPAFQWQRLPVGSSTWVNVTADGSYAVGCVGSSVGSPATRSTLTVNAPTGVMNGDQFRCVAANVAGTATSLAAMLTVNYAPVFSLQPSSLTVASGLTVSFSAAATGNPATTSYLWQLSIDGGATWRNLGTGGQDSTYYHGWTTATLGLNFVSSTFFSGEQFRSVATNTAGSTTSDPAVLSVLPPPPVISTESPAITVVHGGSASLTVGATGTGLSYQWYFGNSGDTSRPLSGATGTGVTVSLTQTTSLWVLVTNAGGSTAGATITVTVSPVAAWGDNSESQSALPAGLTNVAAIAAGDYYSLALLNDGTVVAWGDNSYGECSVPAGLGGVVAIAAGTYNSVALKADGTVVAWGDNSYGECSVPAGLSGVVAITAGYNHCLALKSDGTIVGWGDNTYGEASSPLFGSNIVAVAAGQLFSVALKSDGTVAAWGYDGSGQTDVPAGLGGVTAIAARGYHSLALKADGTVAAWGDNSAGESTVPAGLNNVVAVAAGSLHSLALQSYGTVVAWGGNDMGQSTVPISLSGVTAVAAGGAHSLALAANRSVAVVAPPADASVQTGHNISFTAIAIGTANGSFQWQVLPAGSSIWTNAVSGGVFNVTNRGGAGGNGPGSSTLSVAGTTFDQNGEQFRCVTAIPGASAQSTAATLTVVGTPVVSLPPVGQSATTGLSVSFSVAVTANPAAAYAWQRLPAGGNTWIYLVNDGVNYFGTATTTLTLPGPTMAMNGDQFRCLAGNSYGTAVSDSAGLSVAPPTYAGWVGMAGLVYPNAQPDAKPYPDGLPNLIRYAMNLGSHPAAGQLPNLTVINSAGTQTLALQFRQRKGLTGVQLMVQSSTDLANWSAVPSAAITELADDDANTARFQAVVPVPIGGKVFLRTIAIQNP